MKFTCIGLIVFFSAVLFIPQASFAAQASLDETQSDLQKAETYGNELWARIHGRSPAKKRWTMFGRVGYVYDDNVPLASDEKAFRLNTPDESAGRYLTENGFAYDVYRADKNRLQAQYTFYQSLHDDGLNEFNFQNHEVVLRGIHQLNTERPSAVSLEYAFAHGLLDGNTFSSSNTWTGRWTGSWSEAFPVQIYQSAAGRNYRDKGFRPSDTSRNGYYSRTGLIQSYKFQPLKAVVYAGYEFAFDAVRGNNFDDIANGVQAGWHSPLIEKVRLNLSTFLQDAYYNHYSGAVNRNDFKTQYEARLVRPFGRYFELQVFYRRTDVNTSHDGALGLFDYNRNMYGAEWHYSI